MAKEKPVGEVTHYYDKIGVAIVKFNKAVSVGDKIKFKGANVEFEQEIESMQFDHKEIKSAKKGQEIGIKVDQKVHEGNEVYEG